ncbi:hypothetical protein [Ensifer soli]|uniref:hypothetical protein n=1 Tax=Ciceribacter sp. sgz301302 TaxID=3342379 RepID=UPI0035B95141
MGIEFVNVGKTLREKKRKTKVFEEASALFDAGRVSGVLGASSSGKSTLVNLAISKLLPDAGRVRRSALISFPVAGGGVFNGSLSARENIAFLCRVFGHDPVPILRFIRDFAEVSKEVTEKPFGALTREQRTRLMFTTSYAIPFDLYIADSAVVGGTGAFREQCEELVRERMKQSGFLIVTSTPRLLSNFCNAFFVIENHRIVEVESAEAAKARLGDAKLTDGEGAVDELVETGENDYIPLL